MFSRRRSHRPNRFSMVAMDAIDALHVYPLRDVVAHDLTLESGHECVCGPTIEPVAGCWIVRHHALDGREHHEPNHDRAACPVCNDD
jgi:nitrogen fixation protein FixH